MDVAERAKRVFYGLYERGTEDGTSRTDITGEAMFSGIFHIMLAAVTRYAVGLVYTPETGADPESELILLENALLREFTTG